MSDTYWVHCEPHGAPHMVVANHCWCGVVQADLRTGPPMQDTTRLNAVDRKDVRDECRQRGLWLYHDWLVEHGR